MTKYACRICSSPNHDLILDFGQVALADSFLTSESAIESEMCYPLTLVHCNDCLHVQIKEVLDPNLLFVDYVWETGIPASIKRYCTQFADSLNERLTIEGKIPKILEIASNDGTMLREFKSRGFDIVGVDPAKNIAQKANASGIPTVADFFGERVAQKLLASDGKRDVIVARNVLAHVADLHGLVSGIRLLLADKGIAIIEVPHLLTTYNELQYDQVFHEHIGYHSLDSIIRLFRMHGLAVWDVEQTWIHGGTLRAYISHTAAGRCPSSAVADMLLTEKKSGILDSDGWKRFGDLARRQRHLLRQELTSLQSAGKTVIGYGASGKGQSMIQFCQLDSSLVRYIVDKSQSKIGKVTPGSHIPIVSPDLMRNDSVDVVLLFAWNFVDEILAQESAMVARGVRFLHPIPEPHYV